MTKKTAIKIKLPPPTFIPDTNMVYYVVCPNWTKLHSRESFSLNEKKKIK